MPETSDEVPSLLDVSLLALRYGRHLALHPSSLDTPTRQTIPSERRLAAAGSVPVVVYALAILGLCGSKPARADVILDPLTTSVTLQAMISDADIFLLTQFVGFQAGQTLSYNSTSDSFGWSSLPPVGTPTLFGTYEGQSLNVTYDGSLSALPAGAVTWTSAGSYGLNLWSGGGSAVITDTSPVSFTIHFLDNVTLGSDSGSYDVTIPGIFDVPVNPSEIDFLASSETGTVMVNKKPTSFPPLGLTFKYRSSVQTDFNIGDFEIIKDNHGCTPRPGGVSSCGPGFAPSVTSVTLSGTISTVPEPSTLPIVGSGAIALVYYACRRRKSGR